MKYLIFGLGNIGAEYAETRHNVGFMVLDLLCGNATFSPTKYGVESQIKYKGRTLILIKPNTYMNLSGKAVKYHVQYNKVPLENMLIITDDIALDLGTVRIRPKGSDGGHNGLKNINEALGSNTYPRLRIGVGANFKTGTQVNYVLSPFKPSELDLLKLVLHHAHDAALQFTTIGIDQTMTLFNKTLKV